jgi:REP element-mobilizing transposase RayT
LLRPDPEVTAIFEYLLGVLSSRHGVEIHAYVVMSNHYHLVATDTRGRLPSFQQQLNSLLARAINASRGRWESLWDRESYSAVVLLEDGDVVSKMAYTLANPVAARLVNRARQWEGATSVGVRFGRVRRVGRPRGFFTADMPEEADLVITRPTCFAELDDEELLGLVDEEVERREAESAARGPALGMARVMRQHWGDSPSSFEVRRGLRPTVAGNRWARIEALQRSRDWLDSYAIALRRFVAGERGVAFPRGTWRMVVELGCCVATE